MGFIKSLQTLTRLPQSFTLRQLPTGSEFWGFENCYLRQIEKQFRKWENYKEKFQIDKLSDSRNYRVYEVDEDCPPEVYDAVEFCTSHLTHVVVVNYLRDANGLPPMPIVFTVASPTQDFAMSSVENKFCMKGAKKEYSFTNAEIRTVERHRRLGLSAEDGHRPVAKYVHQIDKEFNRDKPPACTQRFREVTANCLYYVKSTPLVGGNFYFEQVTK